MTPLPPKIWTASFAVPSAQLVPCLFSSAIGLHTMTHPFSTQVRSTNSTVQLTLPISELVPCTSIHGYVSHSIASQRVNGTHHVIHLMCHVFGPTLTTLGTCDHCSHLGPNYRLRSKRLAKHLALVDPSSPKPRVRLPRGAILGDRDLLEHALHNQTLQGNHTNAPRPTFVIKVSAIEMCYGASGIGQAEARTRRR